MADLHRSGGSTLADGDVRAAPRAPSSRPWDRRAVVPPTAADRGTFWAPQAEDGAQYPTRMARRRALAAAQVRDRWQPDPVLTPALLKRVGEELLRLFDASASGAVLTDDEAVDDEADTSAAGPDRDRTRASSGRRRAPVGWRGWHRRGRPAAADPVPSDSVPSDLAATGLASTGPASTDPAPTRGSTPATVTDDVAPAIVRQDDPVDDAAWFAGLKELTKAEELAERAAAAAAGATSETGTPSETGATGDGLTRTTSINPRTSSINTPASTQSTTGTQSTTSAQSTTEDRAVDAPTAGPADADAVSPRSRADVQQIVPTTASRRRARPGRRWVAAGVAAAVLVAAGVAVALNRGGSGSHHPAGAAVTPQRTVVVAFSLSPKAADALRAPSTKGSKSQPAPARAGDVTGLSLLAAGGGSAQQVLVPSQLLLDVPGAGRVPLSRSLLGSTDAPGQAIGDALEVRVDATWTLDSTALAALVDRVGGVVVDVDADVTKGPQAGAAVLLGAGRQQKLVGEQAALFAQFLGPQEPEAVRLARQEQVLRAVLTALPDDPATIRTIVSGLPGAPKGTDLDAVAAVVSASRLAAASNDLASTVLPVKEIDAGGTTTAYGLEDKATAQLVQARLAGAELPVAAVGHVRVLVQNGVGTPGLGDSARSQLLHAGLRYVAGGNLPGFGQDETVVLLRDGSSTNRERGMAVARALGLGQSSLRISESAPTIADVVVILGSDYRPR